MNPALGILAIIAFIAFYVYRLVATRPFSARMVWLLPLIAGFIAVSRMPAGLLQDDRELLSLAISAGMGIAAGVFQGLTVRIFQDEHGAMWQKGSWQAGLVLLATLPLRIGLRVLLLGGPSYGGADAAFILASMLCLLMAARGLTILLRYPELEAQLFEPRQRRLTF